MQTTSNLPLELLDALTTAGLSYKASRNITNLLPPAGQHTMLTAAREGTLRDLATDWIGDTADMLRLPHHEAGIVRSELQAVTR